MKEIMKFAVSVAIYGALLSAAVISICLAYSWYTGEPVILNSVTFCIALLSGTIAREILESIEIRFSSENADEEAEIEKG